ncbi:NlpC/P60 family protein [Arthrobacter sp. 2RAF22]|uniref:NlpC/P60 family protein n=1 Tax=Arthrobacter sp. 2RAF22 TaxID=3232996 RepID=UPI003F90729D
MATTTARHRAETASPITAINKALDVNDFGRRALVVAVTSGLALTGSTAAHADTGAGARESQAPAPLTAHAPEEPAIVASPAARISFERPAVSSKAAPAPTPPVTPAAPHTAAAPPSPARAGTTTAGAPVQGTAPAGAGTGTSSQATTPAGAGARTGAWPQAAAPAGRPATQSASSVTGAAIIAAAYAQLGVAQDCTMLVTHSLAAAGINFHGWPADYLTLGRTVSAADARPGDLVYYPDGGMGEAHIAVYAGNGQAVHGGWNGNTTVLFSVNVGKGHTFIRVGS